MEDMETVANAIIAHRWRTEKRAGVEHFKTGQHIARKCAGEDGSVLYLMAYAPADGHSILILPFHREDADWKMIGDGESIVAVRATRHRVGWEVLPSTWQLTTPMRKALDAAL